jgi:hypothetical protein
MRVDRLADGLWRWTAPHPAWSAEPDEGWERDVACLYHEAPDGIVLIDPLVPDGDEGERFWRHLDADVARVGLPPTIAVTCPWHGRSADRVRKRYPGAHLLAVPDAACSPDSDLADGLILPGGVRVLRGDGPGVTRMAVLACDCHGLVWTSDLLLGAEGGLRRPPEDDLWLPTEAERAWMREGLPRLVARLAGTPVAFAVPAHGEPVLEGAPAAIEAALA